MAEALAQSSELAICPSNFSIGGTKYPISYYMKKKIEGLMEDKGCLHVPPQSQDQLLDSVVEYRVKVARGEYARAHKFAEREAMNQSSKERRLVHGETPIKRNTLAERARPRKSRPTVPVPHPADAHTVPERARRSAPLPADFRSNTTEPPRREEPPRKGGSNSDTP